MKQPVFGEELSRLITAKGWDVKTFLARMESHGKKLSPSYITRVLHYGEIPSPQTILTIAKVTGSAPSTLIELGIKQRVARYERSIRQTYAAAVRK